MRWMVGLALCLSLAAQTPRSPEYSAVQARLAQGWNTWDVYSVAAQVRALFEAGATDVCAAPFPVGDDATASRARTRALLASLARA